MRKAMSPIDAAVERRYVFNNSITTTSSGGSASSPMIVCEVPATRGAPAHFAFPESVLECLQLFDGNRTTAEVAAICRAGNPSSAYSEEKLSSLAESFLVPKRILF